METFEVVGKIKKSCNLLIVHKQNNEIAHFIILNEEEYEKWRNEFILKYKRKIRDLKYYAINKT